MFHPLFLIASVVIGVIGLIPYVRDILRGSTKPNIAGWLTWTLLTAVATIAEFGAGELTTAIITLFATLQTGLVVILGLKYGYAHYHWSDVICQIGAGVGLFIWIWLRSSDLAVLLTVSVDALGAIPTFRHAWERPYEETPSAFLITSIAGLASIIAVSDHTVTSLAYPVYLTFANLLLTAFILARRRAYMLAD